MEKVSALDDRPSAAPPTATPEPTLRELLTLVREDREANLGEWRYPGFQALLAYRLGRFGRRVSPGVLRRLVLCVPRTLRRRATRRYGIELHETALIGRRVRIIHQSGIAVHAGVVIGDGCWIRQGVQLGARWVRTGPAPVLGKDVRLGVNVSIVGDVIVGNEARIGPNCVISRDVPEGSAVMPARHRTKEREE